MFSTVMSNDLVAGESILKGYENWIDLTSIGHQIDLPMTIDKTSNSRTCGRPNMGDFKVTMLLNKSYPKFIEYSANAKNIGVVKIAQLRMNEKSLFEIVRFDFENVYISSVIMQGGASGLQTGNDAGHALVSVNLNYDAVSVIYKPMDNTGKDNGNVACGPIRATTA